MLSVKHLNTDASFLLTFEPLPAAVSPTASSHPHPEATGARPYHVLLDPWIVGSSKIFHSKISLTKHTEPACVTSLRQLPEPDLVIISQSKSDHCNEATLKQIPPASKTIILAEPAAAKVIQSWKHFDRRKVRTLKKWEESRGRQNVVTRIPLPPSVPGGEPGEVTVAFIPQRRDLTGLHAAIGITFRSSPRNHRGNNTTTTKLSGRTKQSDNNIVVMPPPSGPPPSVTFPITPPPTPPRPHRSYPNLPTLYTAGAGGVRSSAPPSVYPLPSLRLPDGHDNNSPTEEQQAAILASALPPPLFTIPQSPTSTIRSVRSCSTLTPTNTISSSLSAAATLIPSSSSRNRTLSVLFSPHGIPFSGNLESYATTHLVNEAALPLTALLHCFDCVRNPWWLGGNVLLGAPAGREIAVRLGAKCWVSCHDGDKDVKGLATGWVKTRRWERSVLERAVTGEGRDLVDAFGETPWDNDKEKEKSHKMNSAGENKRELRRVGSKLRLWPSPPPSMPSKDNKNIPLNNEEVGLERKSSKGREIIPSLPPVKVGDIFSPTSTTTTTTTTTPLTKSSTIGMASPTNMNSSNSSNQGTHIIDLASGEMVLLTSEGPWNMFRGQIVPL